MAFTELEKLHSNGRLKVALIGPLPLPINGCSYANQILLQNLKDRDIRCSYVDTNTKVISGRQGNTFSIGKAFSFFKTYIGIYKLFSCTVAYMTPGQTFFGVLKYAPFISVCKLLRKPYIIHVHGNYLGSEYETLTGVKRKLFKFLIGGAAAGIVLSPSLIKNFEKLLSIDKVHTVENFVDSSLLGLPIKKSSVELHILYLSNLMREKGILELLDALIELKTKAVNFKVTIAGGMEKGIQLEVEKRFSALQPQLTYVGTVMGMEKQEVFKNANVFVLPTYYIMEGQPICLLEAMATGNVVVTTAHAGIPDIITGNNGYIIKIKSAADIAECLESISGNLRSTIDKFSAYNMQYAAERFTEVKFTDKILTILYGVTKA